FLVNGATPLVLAGPTSEAGVEAPASWAPRETGVEVIFVGLDGADWRVIDPMMAAGELPAFEGMARQGVTASLTTLPDANSAVIWATIFSGASRQRHGVEDFYRVEVPGLSTEGLFPVHRTFFQELADLLEPTGLLRRTLVTRYSHHAVPWWEVADQAGLSIGVVDGYLMSFPAYAPKTEGSYFVSYGADSFARSLAQRGPKDVGLFLEPPELFRELRDSLESGGDFVWQSNTLQQLLADKPHPRFVTFYTHEPDSAQHKYWKWHEPERYFGVSAKELAEKGEAIEDLHRDFDTFLGNLRQAVGPEPLIVVASDHGHSPTLVHKLFTQHRHGPPGILLMEGGPLLKGMRLEEADVHDLFPTLLYLLGLPVPEDGPGRVLEEALDPDFLARFPVETIPSYEFLEPAAGGAAGLDPERNRQELEKLKSLGYI
ncbi:MAG: alkaline phosphatase family protein, partial [Acidobacteria bacterium]|nr:alkaline phosphatase family protein [Acidobacteriota bacterium]